MKKYLCLPLLIILCCGCAITKVKEESFDSIIDTVLYKDANLFNTSFEGYKFYLPRGASVSEKKEYNLEIKDQTNYYYLYVDTIAYYYKTKADHKVDEKIFYSKNLEHNGNFGYIDISKVDNKYFLEIMYNYSKIEAYVTEENLYDSFFNMCYILSTIDYYDSAINYRLSNKDLVTSTEEFNIFTSKKDADNFLEYVEEFDTYDGEEEKNNNNNNNQDGDIIDTEIDDN